MSLSGSSGVLHTPSRNAAALPHQGPAPGLVLLADLAIAQTDSPMHACTPACLQHTSSPAGLVTPAPPRPQLSPPPHAPFLTTTLAPSTFTAPLLEPTSYDYFPSVYLSEEEPAQDGLMGDVWDFSATESSLDDQAGASLSLVGVPLVPSIDDQSLLLAVGPSPLGPSALRPLPPTAMRCSTVVSCLGRIEDGMCGACGTWVVGAVTWTLPGNSGERWDPDWTRWYKHAQDCRTGPPRPPLADLSPPSRSSSPSPSPSSPTPYKPLFPPPFDAPPSLITHMPPTLFLSPPYPDWSALLPPPLLHSPLLHEPAPHPPDTLVPPFVVNGDEPLSAEAAATHAALRERVLEWRSASASAEPEPEPEPDEPAVLRDSTTAALAAVWGSADALVEPVGEADKENVPGGGASAGKTPKYGLRTRTKRRATEFSHEELALGAALPLLPAPAPATPTSAPQKKRKVARA